MDPLSLTASIIAVVGAAGATANGVKRLVGLRHAPALLMALVNEISDMQSVLSSIQLVVEEIDRGDHGLIEQMGSLVQRANGVIKAMDAIIMDRLHIQDRSISASERTIFSSWGWLRHETSIHQLMTELREVRQNLSLSLTTYTAREIPNVRASLDDIVLQIQDFNASLQGMDDKTTEHLRSLSSPLHPLSILLDELKGKLQQTPQAHSPVSQDADSFPEPKTIQYVRIRTTVGQQQCRKLLCPCKCHKEHNLRTPMWLRSAIGTLFIGYSGVPLLTNQACSEPWCQSEGRKSFKFTYYFPIWLLKRMLSVVCITNPLNGTILTVRTPRIISADSDVFSFARGGYIEGLQQLFSQSLASPFDVSAFDGRTALCHAVTSRRAETAAFLLNQHADPYHQDNIAQSAIDLVWMIHLKDGSGRGAKGLVQAFSGWMDDTEDLSKMGLNPLHRVVLKLSSVDLNSLLDLDIDHIDSVDYFNRTPLSWAAAADNLPAIKTLLRRGAALDVPDGRGMTPLHHVAMMGSLASTEAMLAEAWARENSYLDLEKAEIPPSFPTQRYFSTLIDDCQEHQGRSPLHWAVRQDHVETVRLLLYHGASIEFKCVRMRTPLFYAIYCNSHKTMRMLIEEGARADQLTKRDETILHYAARYANLESLRILATADLSAVDVQARDKTGLVAQQTFDDVRPVSLNAEEMVHDACKAAFQDLVAKAFESSQLLHFDTDDSDCDYAYQTAPSSLANSILGSRAATTTGTVLFSFWESVRYKLFG